MNSIKNEQYWYGAALNKVSRYTNLLIGELKKKSKTQLQDLYDKYWEYSCNLHWEKESDVEYKHYKNLKKYDREIERTNKNLDKITKCFNAKKA